MTEEEKSTLETLIEFYKEHCSHGRHTETQRQAAGTLLMTIGGALIALMGALQFSIHCLPLAFLLIGVGIFGRRFMQVFEIKWKETEDRRNFYRGKIQEITTIPTPPVKGSSGTARKFWRNTFNGVTLIGVVCLLIVSVVVAARYTQQRGTWQERIEEQLSKAKDEGVPSSAVGHGNP